MYAKFQVMEGWPKLLGTAQQFQRLLEDEAKIDWMYLQTLAESMYFYTLTPGKTCRVNLSGAVAWAHQPLPTAFFFQADPADSLVPLRLD